MNKVKILCLLLFSATLLVAQKPDEKKEPKPKKSVIDKVNQIGSDLIAQPDQVDTMGGKFVQDALSISVPPSWKTLGSMLFNDLKVTKTDKPPLDATLPLPQKHLIQGVTLTLNSIKRKPEEKKQMVLKQLTQHLTQYYKDAGKPANSKQISDLASTMITGPEKFTTAQGKEGDIYLIHDIESQQNSFDVLLLIPVAETGMLHFVQFQYFKYNYETTFPDDIMEWRTFVYPDDQQTYVDFSKKLMKTLVIK